MQAPVQNAIVDALNDRFVPAHLEVLNESGKHNVPPGSETHFKVIVVSDAFDGCNLVKRHRLVNQALAQVLAGPVHALSVEAYTPSQWFKETTGPNAALSLETPDCISGGGPGSAAEKLQQQSPT